MDFLMYTGGFVHIDLTFNFFAVSLQRNAKLIFLELINKS